LALLLTDLLDSTNKLDKLETLLDLVGSAQSQCKQPAVSDGFGVPLFTAAGSQSAKQEISTVGIGSSVGVVLLMLLTFRSPRPLLLSFWQ